MTIETLYYVINGPYFWLSMGMTTAISIFIGAIIYDGNLGAATKGIISVLSYGFFVFQVSYTRISSLVASGVKVDPTRFGGQLTILIITLFWLLGVLLGVTVSKLVRKGKISL